VSLDGPSQWTTARDTATHASVKNVQMTNGPTRALLRVVCIVTIRIATR